MQSTLDPLWVESIEMLGEDLRWLLELEHCKFWRQVHVTSLCRALDFMPVLVLTLYLIDDVRCVIVQVT